MTVDDHLTVWSRMLRKWVQGMTFPCESHSLPKDPHKKPMHAGPATLHDFFNFTQGRHRCVSRGGHGECTVGCTIINGLGGILRCHEPIDCRKQNYRHLPLGREFQDLDKLWTSETDHWPSKALQSLMVAVLTARSVVAVTLKLENSVVAFSIIFLVVDFDGKIFSSTPSTSKPRHAVKSSSFPIMTSTYWAMLLTSVPWHVHQWPSRETA